MEIVWMNGFKGTTTSSQSWAPCLQNLYYFFFKYGGAKTYPASPWRGYSTFHWLHSIVGLAPLPQKKKNAKKKFHSVFLKLMQHSLLQASSAQQPNWKPLFSQSLIFIFVSVINFQWCFFFGTHSKMVTVGSLCLLNRHLKIPRWFLE